MARNRSITLAGNGANEISLLGTYLTAYVRSIEWSPSRPTQGTLLIEVGDSEGNWKKMRGGEIDLSQPLRMSPFISTQVISKARITLEGVSGSPSVTVKLLFTSHPDASLDEGVYNGKQGVTTQGFPEANSKNGTQFEFSQRISNLVSLTPQYIGFETGDFPVIVKQRDVYGGFVNADLTIFEGATYTGGTPIEYSNNNSLVDNAGGVNIVLSPSVSNEGDQFGIVTPLLGSEGIGGRLISTFGGAAGEKILAPNTKYLIKFSNLATTAIALLSIRVYWYEGPLSTDL